MRILLVEDDESISQALEQILTSQNYVVDVANNGQEGWDLVEAFIYDLILLDIVLPKLDGIRLCRNLRENGYQMPILLLTAQNSSNDKVMGLDAGADDYVVKPFELPELLARVRVLLRRNSSSKPVTLEWSNLCLDPGLCQVTYNGQLLELTPKEYRLIELFLRNHHRVFSRGDILDHLWPNERAPSEDAVTVHIKDLRKKLKRLGAPSNFIETVYGQGYRLKQFDGALSDLEPSASSVQIQEHQTYAKIKEELALVWEKHKTLNYKRLELLENASQKVLENNLREEQWQQAQQVAHKLTGALGIFGFVEASHLAKKVEVIFEACEALNSRAALQLCELLSALRAILEPSNNALSVTLNSNPVLCGTVSKLTLRSYPLLLVIDNDPDLAAGVVKLATTQGMSIKTIPLPTPGNRKSTHIRQAFISDVGVLNFSLTDATDVHLGLLKDLVNQTPPVSILLMTDRHNLANRVKVAHLATHVCLQKPLLPEQVLEALAKARSHGPSTVARVMVVDDDANILAGMRTLLEPLGLNLQTLGDPLQFLSVLEKFSPDLLVLDLKMPHFSGVELCQVLRNMPQWHWLPILFLTAHTDERTINQMFTAGANEYISKTVSQSELMTRILNCLERSFLHRSLASLSSS
jgi:DNA-binding response OmpR family regulator/HPt (histidine-containing phosphotransfer) domain-containing protein